MDERQGDTGTPMNCLFFKSAKMNYVTTSASLNYKRELGDCKVL